MLYSILLCFISVYSNIMCCKPLIDIGKYTHKLHSEVSSVGVSEADCMAPVFGERVRRVQGSEERERERERVVRLGS